MIGYIEYTMPNSLIYWRVKIRSSFGLVYSYASSISCVPTYNSVIIVYSLCIIIIIIIIIIMHSWWRDIAKWRVAVAGNNLKSQFLIKINVNKYRICHQCSGDREAVNPRHMVLQANELAVQPLSGALKIATCLHIRQSSTYKWRRTTNSDI